MIDFITVLYVGLLLIVIWTLCGWVIANLIIRATRPKTRDCTCPNLFEHRWLEGETPMILQYCPDCVYFKKGRVHTDPSTWLKEE